MSSHSYRCPDSICSQIFVDLDAFHKHWTRHRNQCPFSFCETHINSRYNFGRHCARKHGDHFVEYQTVDETACKFSCGKLYTPANVSNRKRHEKTCRGRRIRSQPQDHADRVGLPADSARFVTDQGSHYDTSRALHNELPGGDAFQNSPPPDRPVLSERHTLHTRVVPIPTRDDEDWQNSQPIVEAIQTLQQLLAGGPAADALQAFTSSLNELVPYVHIPRCSSSSGRNGIPRQSDECVNLGDIPQGVYDRRTDTEAVDSPHILTMNHGLVEDSESDGEITPDNRDRILEAAFEITETFLTSVSRTPHRHQNLIVNPVEEVSSFCEWFEMVLVSIKLTLHPNVISLALLIVHQLKRSPDINCKPGREHHIIHVALLLAESYCGHRTLTAAAWAGATGIPEAHISYMKTEFDESTDDMLRSIVEWDGDMLPFSDALNQSFNLYAEFRNSSPQSLLMRIGRWHLLFPWNGRGWYQWDWPSLDA